jgi:hypothetical protein
MNQTGESETSDSWIERGRAIGAVTSPWSADTGEARGLEIQGWDPYDVWLRRIDLPRRHRAHGRDAPPTDVAHPG